MITSFRGEYGFLSNFAEVDILYGDHIFPSVEHFYVAMKTQDELKRKAIVGMTAGEAKKYGRNIEVREDWEEIKLGVMNHALRIKFQNPKFRKLLLATGNQNIQEGNFWNDVFWGVDLKQNPNVGENHLGRLLMRIREDINDNIILHNEQTN